MYRYCIRVAPKVKAERIVAYIDGDHPLGNKRVVIKPNEKQRCPRERPVSECNAEDKVRVAGSFDIGT